MPDLHPLLPIAGAILLLPLLPKGGRRLLCVLAPLAVLGLILARPEGPGPALSIAGLDLRWIRLDALSRLFASAFAAFASVAFLYGWEEDRAGVRAAALGLAGSAVGVVLAGDLVTLFLFWEGLTICSLCLIWSGGSRASLDAGIRYLLVHVAGAASLLSGILLILGERGSVGVGPLGPLSGPGPWLVLAGFAVNAAIPPLHAWLPDAYPRSSIFGSAFLSAFTTKAAVCVLIRCFPGETLLLWAGAGMALVGVVFAVLENDLRRLLSYHIVSQVGFMVCGVGLGTAAALDGAAAHAFSHIFYKGLLLMAAGALIHATGRSRLSDLGGLAPRLRWTTGLYLVGAFSISGVPLFSGFVSKSMVIDAAGASGPAAVELLLLAASVGTFLSVGLKLPWFAFFGKGPAPELKRPVPAPMIAAMAAAGAVCVVTGLAPALLYRALPHGVVYAPYSAGHVLGTLQLLVATGLAFRILRDRIAPAPSITMDLDRLYRRGLPALLERAGGLLDAVGRGAGVALSWWTRGWNSPPGRSATIAVQAGVLLASLVAVSILILARGRTG